MLLDRYLLLIKRRNGINYQRYRLKIVDHFAQDGLAPLLSQKVDKWDEKQFKTWCDYHYSVCREQSVLGASNHVIIIGRK